MVVERRVVRVILVSCVSSSCRARHPRVVRVILVSCASSSCPSMGPQPMGKLSVERVRQVEVEHLDKSSGSGSSASEIGILRLA
ncbi:unnamed protein product [Lampetra fluviatilis]